MSSKGFYQRFYLKKSLPLLQHSLCSFFGFSCYSFLLLFLCLFSSRFLLLNHLICNGFDCLLSPLLCLLLLFQLVLKSICGSLNLSLQFGLFFSCFSGLLLLLILPCLNYLSWQVVVNNSLIQLPSKVQTNTLLTFLLLNIDCLK